MINGIVAIVNPRQRLPQGLLVRIQGRAQILQVRILVPEAGVEEAQKNVGVLGQQLGSPLSL